METLTPMALALCVSLHVQCTYAANLFMDSVFSKVPETHYNHAVACIDDDCAIEDEGSCVAIARYNYPSEKGIIYFCRPDPENQGDS